jgi:hypothetical protein
MNMSVFEDLSLHSEAIREISREDLDRIAGGMVPPLPGEEIPPGKKQPPIPIPYP